MKITETQIKATLLGVGIGDALGVPVEFRTRSIIAKNPVTDMIGFGTHQQAAGTFSDDASLTYCLAEALTQELDLKNVAQNFINWYYQNYWTAHGRVFDVGIATREAIYRLATGCKPELAGGTDLNSNGNGSLMRISPLVFYICNFPIEERYRITKNVSSITHGHVRSIMCCFYYLEFARQLLEGVDKFVVYQNLKTELPTFFKNLGISNKELENFDRLLTEDIYSLEETEVISSGYVLRTLEASVWCLLNTANFKDAVLKAVNLGDDTDTTGAVTGALAGLLYGYDTIPKSWINTLARNRDIENLAKRMATFCLK